VSLTKWDGPGGGFINSTRFFMSVPLDDAMERYSSEHRRVLTPGSSDLLSKPLVSCGLFVDLLRTKNDFNG
jgi:hypothetical protein